jgi:hypothetical protein
MLNAGVSAFLHSSSTSQHQTSDGLDGLDGGGQGEEGGQERQQEEQEQQEQQEGQGRMDIDGVPGSALALSCSYRLCQDALPFLLPTLTRKHSPRLLALAPVAFAALLRQRTIPMRARAVGEEGEKGEQDEKDEQDEQDEQELQDLQQLSSLVSSLAEMAVGALAVVTDMQAGPAPPTAEHAPSPTQSRHVSQQQHQPQPPQQSQLQRGGGQQGGGNALQRPCLVAWRGRGRLDTLVKRLKREGLLSLCQPKQS